jgi:hypothetical protein
MQRGPLYSPLNLLNRILLAGKAVIALLLALVTGSLGGPPVMAEGSPQVMPNPLVNGVGMYIGNGSTSGPYRSAPAQNRLRFYINNNLTENLYFNVKVYNRATNLQIPVYYRILDAAGTQITGPTQITTANQISTYAQTVEGPNISGATPAGYAPFSFNPTADGEYYIEIYHSSDAGASATFNQDALVTLFDFTVATTTNLRSTGRVYCQAWSLLSYDPATNTGSIINSLESDFYGYTADSAVIKLDLQTGFRPFGFILYMNKYGAVNGSNWVADRKSRNTGVSAPSLPNGYPLFLNAPDAVRFPIASVATAPQFAGKIYGCASNLSIPFYIDKPGDIAILLDINGATGYQEGTSDRLLYFYDVPVGHNIGAWDGLDGSGNTVSTAVPFNMSLSIRRGRVNMPMYDAELNSFGLNVTGVSPVATIPKLYFDDALLANTASTACAVAADGNTNNNTGTGIANTNVGVPSPGRAWDGAGSGNAVPAPTGTGGSTTLSLTCDDYGNLRTINTWCWAYEVSSAVYAVSISACSADGDAVPYTTDLDDDNDGVTDIAEGGGTDPNGDADLDGTPNFLDITPGGAVPAFVDVNTDGVNDNYDADLDGVVNSFDLDSDNDGIPDIIEAGGVDTDNDSKVDGATDVNGNGLIDTYDPAAGGTALSNAIGATLPVTLVKFSAEKQAGNTILVTWQAQHEVNFKEYVLERSTDGEHYTAVTIVAGKGGLVSQYVYTDNTGLQTGAKLYYRLRLVDINNRSAYSRILSVSLTPISGITLLVTPNPAGKNIALKISSDKKRAALVNIIDKQGHMVAVQRISITNGNNIIVLAGANRLINGIYTVLINTGEERLSAKLVIQR